MTQATDESDRIHLNAWADTHEGYSVRTKQAVLKCLWCDYTAIAPTKKEAIALYKKQHEQPIVDRA